MIKKHTRRILVLALFLIFSISFSGRAEAISYRLGSSGETVKKIQQFLKNNGLYSYTIDGIYGSRTESAVKKFQQNTGITADGICGQETLKHMGISISSSGASSANSQDLALLTRIIAAEARGEPYKGQVAVGAVILNRVKHSSFPNTLSGVVFQSGAFTAISDGQFDSTSIPDSCRRAASDALNGWDPTGGCIYYFNPATATSKWIWSRQQVMTIGKHIFCI